MAPVATPSLERGAFLDDLIPGLLEAIERRDTDEPVFHGCYDWHSAVHGHWAILRIDLATGRHRKAAERVAARLTDDGLAAETARLAADPTFEMPYGRAWFLRLALDHERWATRCGRRDSLRLRPFAKEVYASLGSVTGADATTHEYASVEWALAQRLGFQRATRSANEVPRRLAADALRGPPLAGDAHLPEFFSPTAGWLYLAAVAGEVDRALSDPSLVYAEADLQPVVWTDDRPSRAHHYGMNWSRAWGFAAVARGTSDPAVRDRFLDAWRAHVEIGMRVHERAKGNYDAYDHWVPQFAAYALTPEFN